MKTNQMLEDIGAGMKNVNKLLLFDSIDSDKLLNGEYTNDQLASIIKLLNSVGYKIKKGDRNKMIEEIRDILDKHLNS